MATVGISLGSNLGDRLDFLQQAREKLQAIAEEGVERISSVYETDPVDCAPGDPQFLNAVLEIETALSALDLLNYCLEVEKGFGRPEERATNAPRPIDLDLLYYDDLEMESERLILPHPRLRERGFVLLPLAEIRPDLVSPEEKETHSAGVRIWQNSW